jgi:GTP cyclohydrolase I
MPVDRPAAERAIEAFLRAIGRDPAKDPELSGTPARVTAAYVDELCAGYDVDPAARLRECLVAGTTTIVALRDVAVTTMCPHHLMPASGFGTVAFAPRQRLVGLGELAALLDAFAHRLTLQEAIGEGVATTLLRELDAEWAACRLVMSHACVSARGERKHDAKAETVAFAGDAARRGEALAVLGGAGS